MKRTPLKPMSAKRRKENVERRKNLEATFGDRDDWRCAVRDEPLWIMAMGPCLGPVNGHEVVKRGQGGSITNTGNIILLCNYHNGWVEENRDVAHKFGLVRSSWEVE